MKPNNIERLIEVAFKECIHHVINNPKVSLEISDEPKELVAKMTVELVEALIKEIEIKS